MSRPIDQRTAKTAVSIHSRFRGNIVCTVIILYKRIDKGFSKIHVMARIPTKLIFFSNFHGYFSILLYSKSYNLYDMIFSYCLLEWQTKKKYYSTITILFYTVQMMSNDKLMRLYEGSKLFKIVTDTYGFGFENGFLICLFRV